MVSLNPTPKKKGRLEALEKRLSTTPRPSDSPSPSPIRPGAFTTPTSTRDVVQTGSDVAYAKLCPSVLNGPLSANLQLRPVSDSGAAVRALLTNVLESNTKFAGDVDGTIETRMQDTVLLLDSRATHGAAAERARERARLSRGKRSTKCLSLRQHRKLGSYELPQAYEKHNVYEPLHEMWRNYAEGLMASCGTNEAMIQSRLLTADLHGAVLAVVDCKNPAFIGVQGIMIRETSKTFGLITSKDKFAVIPKAGSTFRVKVKNVIVTLFGNGLGPRGATVANKV
ncbi:unnamed protein product [Calypogeia fissa]